MYKEFEVNKVNEEGLLVMGKIASLFNDLLTILLNNEGADPREMSIVKTKLQEACFFAKKAIAPKYKI